MRRQALWIVSIMLGLALATPANAAFHLMKIVEVFAGTPASPNAQYVVIQMYTSGQNFISGHSIIVADSAGVVVGTFTFPANVANGANQAKVLIATSAAGTFFNVTPNLTMTAVIPPRGGRICFDNIDCVSWGNYAGSTTGVGTPFNASGGIKPTKAMVRRLDITGSPTNLDSGDDSNVSSNDFVFATPAPRNNAGVTGVPPSSTCANGVIEGLEECDGGAGCSPTCMTVGVDDLEIRTSGRVLVTPNPFRSDATLRFALAQAGETEIVIFDLSGRRVRRLYRASLPAGAHRQVWDGRDDAGRDAGAGLYTARIRSNGMNSSTVLVRIR